MAEDRVSVLGTRYQQALVDAATWHRLQERKGTSIPYLSHLLAVSASVMEDGGTEDECIAALLHDAVEDTGTSVDTIRARYGHAVAGIVDACTDDDGGTPGGSDTPKPPWWQRKVDHIAHVAHLAEANPSVVRVTAADKLANLRSTLDEAGAARRVGGATSSSATPDVFGRFKSGLGGFAWYQATFGGVLLDALGAGSLLGHRLASALEELQGVVVGFRGQYGEVLLATEQRVVGLAAPDGSGAHTPWPWFALDVVHRAGGARPDEDTVLRAAAGWFAQPLGKGADRSTWAADLRSRPQVRVLLDVLA